MSIKTLSEILVEMGETPISTKQNDIPDVLTVENFDKYTTRSPSKQPVIGAHTAKFYNQRSTKQTPINRTKQRTQNNAPTKQNLPINQNPIADDNNQHTKSSPRTTKSSHKSNYHKQKQRSAAANTGAPQPISKTADTLGKMNTSLAQTLAGVDIEPIVQNDRATNYMRWLAFYYLANRELSRHQLREKLLAKGCEADAVDALVQEFAEKDYQSDERCAHMLIRESIRKNRGKQHIIQALKEAKLSLPDTPDELIARADLASLSDGTILQNTDQHDIDWLMLAVQARCKKYGDAIPIAPKDKARQLRFLQYRGFDLSICFEALKYTLADLMQSTHTQSD